jgi:hypothetical protein
MRTLIVSLTLLATIAAGGCGKSSPPAKQTTAAPSTPTITWLLADAPANAVPVAEAKKTAKAGEEIAVRGRIGGRKDPMNHDAAVFVMMDPSVPSCKDKDTACKRPWDYCCETPEDITANSATVQLVGDTASTLAIDLAEHGFAPLDEVVVVGTVAPRPTDAVLVIQATKIHRVHG